MSSQLVSIRVCILLFQLNLFYESKDCKSFCGDPKIDSALSYMDKNIVFLFSGDKYTIYRPQYSSVIQDMFNIRDILEGESFKHGHVLNFILLEQNIDTIDTIFMNTQNLVYIFSKNKYYLTRIEERTEGEFKFIALTPEDSAGKPTNWDTSGDLSNWFPNNMDDAILIGDNLLIFHGSSIRYTKVENHWPKEDKIEIEFRGSLNTISKIDAIFKRPLSEDIVIIVGNKYCQFNKSQIDFNSISELNISCQWKDSTDPQLFNCPPIPSTTSIKAITTEKAITKIETTSSLTTVPIESSSADERERRNNSVIFLLVSIFTVLVLLFIGFVLLIAFLVKKASDKKDTTDPKTTNRSSDLASIVTLDSSTRTESRSQSD